MMGYGYDGGGSWMMWVFGGLMMVGVLVLIGLVAWAIVTATTRAHPGPTQPRNPSRRIRADVARPGRSWTSGTPAAR